MSIDYKPEGEINRISNELLADLDRCGAADSTRKTIVIELALNKAAEAAFKKCEAAVRQMKKELVAVRRATALNRRKVKEHFADGALHMSKINEGKWQ